MEKDIHEQLREAGVAPGKQMTQTEELQRLFAIQLAKLDSLAWILIAGNVQKIYLDKALPFVQACKEAGLRFVDMPKGYTDEGIEEIEIE